MRFFRLFAGNYDDRAHQRFPDVLAIPVLCHGHFYF
jgi:hypothetical protein